MTAYDFIKARITIDEHSRLNGTVYDNDYLVRLLENKNSDKNLREQPDYVQAQDAYIDVTMSCDRGEAIDCMKYFMEKAIVYGLKTGDKFWGYLFLAAYDLKKELMGGYN